MLTIKEMVDTATALIQKVPEFASGMPALHIGDKSDKFRTIDINGAGFTVTYKKVGANGQTSTKSFAIK